MAMRATTVRFSPRAWEVVAAMADADGISAAQWIRESAIAVAYYRLGLEGKAPAMSQAIERARSEGKAEALAAASGRGVVSP